MAGELLLTQEGYDKIVAEHEELVSVRRKEVSEKLKEAISYGDLSENAEYDAAKNEQAELEERIFKLEEMIKTAKIINEAEMTNDFVSVGSKVLVKDVDNDEEMEFTIVGSTEADPFALKISSDSLVGQHLIGKQIGEVVEIIVPDGTLHYQVEQITR
jgi:transcription elongation factor GreA